MLFKEYHKFPLKKKHFNNVKQFNSFKKKTQKQHSIVQRKL